MRSAARKSGGDWFAQERRLHGKLCAAWLAVREAEKALALHCKRAAMGAESLIVKPHLAQLTTPEARRIAIAHGSLLRPVRHDTDVHPPDEVAEVV